MSPLSRLLTILSWITSFVPCLLAQTDTGALAPASGGTDRQPASVVTPQYFTCVHAGPSGSGNAMVWRLSTRADQGASASFPSAASWSPFGPRVSTAAVDELVAGAGEAARGGAEVHPTKTSTRTGASGSAANCGPRKSGLETAPINGG